MLFEGGFTFANFLMDVLAVFVFVVWLWLFVTILGDLIRRRDISGWGKTVWVIFMIVAPYIGVFAYFIFQENVVAHKCVARLRTSLHDRSARRHPFAAYCGYGVSLKPSGAARRQARPSAWPGGGVRLGYSPCCRPRRYGEATPALPAG